MDYVPYGLACSKCGRRILVEVWLIGVSHNASVAVTCADCITELPDAFVAEHPTEAKQIRAFVNGAEGT